MDSDIAYLQAQAELGGYEVVLPSPIKRRETSPLLEGCPKGGVYHKEEASAGLENSEFKKKEEPDWNATTNISDFYSLIKKHSIYTKRSIEFITPIAKINSAYILIFDSPMELTEETKNILDRLFKKLGKEIDDCSITYFFKCEAKAMPREKPLLADMLKKEIELINPNKIIFFNIENKLKTFAGKPTITLYSPFELLPEKPNFKEKMIEVLNICKAEL